MTESQRQFYELYHRSSRVHPIERLKEARRVQELSRLFPREPGEVLFVGCGQGEELGLVSQPATAIDLALTGVKAARSAATDTRLCQADACNLPFRSGAFDTIICSEVIEHIPAAEAAIAEMSRVLCSGGELVLSTPNYWSWFGMARVLGEAITGHSITSGHQPYDRWSSPRSVRTLLTTHFEIERLAGSWYFPPFGRGERQVSPKLTVPLVRFFIPLERSLSRFFPWFGHLVLVLAVRREPIR